MMCNIELPEIRNQWETTNPWGRKLVQGVYHRIDF